MTSNSTDPALALRSSPIVDILIPVFNAERTVESALQSICSQTLREIRIIVVDDGSTDSTPGILRRMADEDSRITVFTTANAGIVDALNRALEESIARFVARHDADDIAFPDRLRRQLSYLEANEDCAAVGCNAFHIDAAGRRTGYVTTFQATVRGDAYSSPSSEPYLLHPFLFARREAVLAAGRYRHVFHSEDTDLYWRLSHEGRLANLVDVLGEYRVHAASISSSSIVNGRISAIHSQRAAVSEQRRLEGRADIEFVKSDLERYQKAEGLLPMLSIASAALDEDETRFLETATASKLLELSSYRPYRLTKDDLTSIRSIVERHYFRLSLNNRLRIVFKLALGPNRLRRDWSEALRLVPWKILPVAVLDLLRFAGTRARGQHVGSAIVCSGVSPDVDFVGESGKTALSATHSSVDRLSVARLVVCIATYRRPDQLARLLRALGRQKNIEPFEIMVGNNDDRDLRSYPVLARPDLPCFQTIAVHTRGVAAVRNAMMADVLRRAPAVRWIACLDDDQVPDDDWLANLCNTGSRWDADLTGGPVVRIAVATTFWSEVAADTSYLPLTEGLTPTLNEAGNLLIAARFLRSLEREPFSLDFGRTGGEDYEFFLMAQDRKARIAWAPEARVCESLDESRLDFRGFAWRFYSIAAYQARADRHYRGTWAVVGGILVEIAKVPLQIARLLVRDRRLSSTINLVVRCVASIAGRVVGVCGARAARYGDAVNGIVPRR